MAVQLKSTDRPTGRRRTSAPVDDAAGRSRLRPTRHRARRPRKTAAQAAQAPARPASIPRDHRLHVPEPGPNAGLCLLLIFLAAIAVMVGAIAVLALVDAWWVLVAAFCLDLVMTMVVLASILWITGDGELPS